jgi:HAMP domain-containing protein
MRFKNLSLSAKFTLTIGFILIIFCIIFSLILYYHLKQRVLEDASEKTRIILTQIDAVGDYVKEELRPAMFERLKDKSEEDFIVEAMSTTHVRLSVMKRFNNELKDYTYKRVSTEPINLNNKADELHEKLIRFFKENKSRESWNGIIKENSQEFLIMAKPINVEKGCLICHGYLKDAPKSLISKYKRTKDIIWKEGEIMGVETVKVPLTTAFGEIKGIAISTFVFGALTLFFLFISIQGAFWRLVSVPLNRLTRIFREIVNGTEPLNQNLPVNSKDEIGELIISFNQMSKHLYEAQEAMKKNAETLKTIFEGISDPLALINPDCTVDLTNQAYRNWMSEGIKAVFSERCEPENCDPDSICPVCFLKRLKQQKTPVSEFWEDEKGNYYYIHLYPIYDDNKEVIKAVHYVKDITEKKNMDEQMKIAEKLAVIGQLSAGLAHEINNPLGGIILCFNNLISTSMDEDMRKKHIEVINKGFQKIQGIIRQLLDFSKQTELYVSYA